MALGTFGGRYKKSGNYEAEGRAQLPLYSREGREESARFVQTCVEQFPDDAMAKPGDELAKVLTTHWLYGCQGRAVDNWKSETWHKHLSKLKHEHQLWKGLNMQLWVRGSVANSRVLAKLWAQLPQSQV